MDGVGVRMGLGCGWGLDAPAHPSGVHGDQVEKWKIERFRYFLCMFVCGIGVWTGPDQPFARPWALRGGEALPLGAASPPPQSTAALKLTTDYGD